MGQIVAVFAAVTQPRYETVRPPEGSWRRGPLPVPSWLPIAAGLLVLIVAAVLLVRRWRRSRR